jgi:hypothetical protein
MNSNHHPLNLAETHFIAAPVVAAWLYIGMAGHALRDRDIPPRFKSVNPIWRLLGLTLGRSKISKLRVGASTLV